MHKLSKLLIIPMVLLVSFFLFSLIKPFSSNAANPVVWDQGFEVDDSGWIDDSTYPGYGEIERVPTGTNGITSKTGDFHALITQEYPFSRFDGYRAVWPGNYRAEVDIYLDTNWDLGYGFDYSVASSGSDGNHQRDFIFHVTKDTSTGDLLVGGSNNTNFNPREDLENINHYTVTQSGWYKFVHSFRDNGGHLAVDLQLYNSSGSLLWTETRDNLADTIPGEVGGNRYAWFTALSNGLELAIDNHRLVIPSLLVRKAEITSPNVNEYVWGNVDFKAYLEDDDYDSVNWAIRKGTCAANTGTVWGNVDGKNNTFSWTKTEDYKYEFMFTGDTSILTDGMYCFVFNPIEDAGETDIRLTRQFYVESPDKDGDGVLDDVDFCPTGTTEDGAWDEKLGVNRWEVKMYNNVLTWYQNKPAKKGNFVATPSKYDIEDTYGCNGHQILQLLKDEFGDSMGGHWKFGLSSSVLMDFIKDVEDGKLDGKYLLWEGLVPATNSTGITTPFNSEIGTKYLLETSGTYKFANWTDAGIADAKYSLRLPGYTNTTGVIAWIDGMDFPAPYTNWLKLWVNGSSPDWNGDTTSHMYTSEFMGDSNPMIFNIMDDNYSDNVGGLNIKVFGIL